MREQNATDISSEHFCRVATSEHLRVEITDAALNVTINRPEKRNALDRRTISELRAVFLDAADRHDHLIRHFPDGPQIYCDDTLIAPPLE